MRCNKRGQALVEFVILLPIFIFMIFAVIDIGKILYLKNNLESRMDDIITSYKNNKTFEEIQEQLEKEHIKLEITKEEYQEIKLTKETDIITPGLNVILGNPHLTEVKRVIYNE